MGSIEPGGVPGRDLDASFSAKERETRPFEGTRDRLLVPAW